MIITRFHGGIGNQMFQYAAGRALALKHDTILLADSRAFKKYRLHHYLIDRFRTEMEEADASNLGGVILPPERRNRLANVLWNRRNRGRLRIFREHALEYQREFETLPRNTYLEGYWQSERYFRDIASQLKDELTRPDPLDDANGAVLREIESAVAVSLHIRRGDYVSNPKTLKIHGTCSLDYYAMAADYIASRIAGDPTFFVFSDDAPWTRDNLRLPFEMRFVSHNDAADPWADLHLMSKCQHHVIANSSFSWWGAWLNRSPEKIVVAPERWFADPNKNDVDLVPADWIRLGTAIAAK